MIEVGEYIRNNNGSIGKITKVIDKTIFYVQYYDNIPFKTDIYETTIKAHSKNIIDLIEVGDIVEIQNKLDGSKTIFNLNKDIISIYKEQLENGSIKLTSILTHEQYEQNCYKVGDIE